MNQKIYSGFMKRPKAVVLTSDEWEAIMIGLETTINDLDLRNDKESDLSQIWDKLRAILDSQE